MLTKRQFIAEQLRKIAPDADWNQGGFDRADELAAIFERNGITDLWALKLIPVTVVENRGGYWEENEAGSIWIAPQIIEHQSYAFDYYGRQIGFLGDPDKPKNEPTFEKTNSGFIIGWSSVGKGHINYVVRPNAAKTAIEIVPVWASSSDADSIRGALISTLAFFAFTALPMAGISVGAAIGNAVLPASLTAAYPAVATAVGNIALSTALNGGDIQSAVKGALISQASGFAGAQAGGFVASATESALIGSLAEAATRTALSGGDVKLAVGMTLAREGVNYMDFNTTGIGDGSSGGFDFFSGGGDWSMPSNSFDVLAPTTGFDIAQFNVGDWSFGADYFSGDFQPVVTLPGQSLDEFSQTWSDQFIPPDLSQFNESGFDPSTWNPLSQSLANPTGNPPAQSPTNPPPANSGVWNPMQIIQGVTAAAMAAISVIKAYRSLDQPKINTTARVVRADGSVSVITDNGLVSTRSPTGQVTSSKPPVGVPQTTVNGNVVVNNGDGSYTVVAPDGRTATYRYSTGAAAASGEGLSPMTLALIAGGAFLLLRK